MAAGEEVQSTVAALIARARAAQIPERIPTEDEILGGYFAKYGR